MTTNDLPHAIAFARSDVHEGDPAVILSQAKAACRTLADEVERLREAIVDCHRWACTVHCCMLDGGPEHDEAFKAAKAAEGGEG